jgi:xylulokinase
MVADITGLPVISPRVTDAAALGAALQAAWCACYPDVSLDDLCARLVRLDEGSRAEPDAGRVAAYADVYARYRRRLADHHGVRA